ncbi:hypothetical protein LINPERPRIM_LOCUS13546 [Linum perenne]
MATTTTSKVTLKLLIDNKKNKVLFAEAGKEFIDFLFTLLLFPLGTMIKLLSKKKMVGCLGNLYQSIEDLSDTFIESNSNKDTVLNPKAPFCMTADSPLLLTDSDGGSSSTSATRTFYMCPTYYLNVADDQNAVCPQCANRMIVVVPYVAPPAVKKSDQKCGFVKGVVTIWLWMILKLSRCRRFRA